MTDEERRQEVREGIARIQRCEDGGWCPEDYVGDDPCPECRTNKLIVFLHSKGVVIETKRELPARRKYKRTAITAHNSSEEIFDCGGELAQQDMLKAGFLPAIPLRKKQ